ncbi:MAG: glycosyltransferase family 39 protein [Thermoguttaceae bacterium]
MPSSISDTQSVHDLRARVGKLIPITIGSRVSNYLRALPADYPNHLAAGDERQRRFPRRYLVVLVLLFFSFIPRALISMKVSSICPDGVLYIRLASELNEGHFQQAFREMNLNFFPVTLVVLKRLGLSWETGGTFWCVLMSSLVVLPLYGFVRRQFDDEAAFIACILYAVHPIFIQWSPEIMRDPTFWFLFTLALYCQWRMLTDLRAVFSFAAGFSITLAVLTRFEGLFLLIPLCLWTFWRYKASRVGREKIKIIVYWLISLIVFPALILLVNITWLRHQSEWVFTRLAPVERLFHWWTNAVSAELAGSEMHGRAISLVRMLEIYVPTMVKSLSPLFALLMLGGIWIWRRMWARRDHQPLFYTALLVMLAAWIQTWFAHEASDRYFLPIVIMGSPFAALGLMALSQRILRLVERLNSAAFPRYVAVSAPILIVALSGWAIAFSADFNRRNAELQLAAWVRETYGSKALLLGSEGTTPVVAYYAGVNPIILDKSLVSSAILEKAQNFKPDAIFLLATNRNNLRNPRPLIEQLTKLGYVEIETSNLPPGTNESLIVLKQGDAKNSASLGSKAEATARK